MQLKVCAGIGDNIWLMMKLLSTGDKFDFELAGDQPHRGKQIFDMLPQLVNSSKYSSFYSGHVIRAFDRANVSLYSELKDQMFLQCNTHLEGGNRIETFLPDLDTVWYPEWDIKNHCDLDGDLIGIYGSCYNVLRHWNFWKEDEWFELISRIHNEHPNYRFAIIGATFDLDMASKLCLKLDNAGIPFYSTVGQPLDYVASLMKKLKFFYCFPSGLGILAHSVKCPTLMFYPDHLKNMKQTWISPGSIENGRFLEEDFITPSKAYELTKDKL